MTHTPRPQSKAVAAGTAAGLRHLERVYVAKVNAALAENRDDLAQELAHDHELTHREQARAERGRPTDHVTAPAPTPDCEPQRTLRRPRWFTRR